MSDRAPEEPAARRAAEALIVDVEGYEGQLDLLLALARSQKVDLRRISVLELAEQYLAFVARAKALRLELAGDYLVMAAWLALLKSQLLLPPDPQADPPVEDPAASLAARLAARLARLEAMRAAAAALMARPQLGRDVFARGLEPAAPGPRRIAWTATLPDLAQAYARLRTRDDFRPYAFERRDVFTMEAAMQRLCGLLGDGTDGGADGGADWTELARWLPPDWRTDPRRRRSATAATLAAALELARQGRLEIAQEASFAPLRLRARR